MIYAHYEDDGPLGYNGDDPRIASPWLTLFRFQTVDDFRNARTAMESDRWPRKNPRVLHIFDDSGEYGDPVVDCVLIQVVEL